MKLTQNWIKREGRQNCSSFHKTDAGPNQEGRKVEFFSNIELGLDRVGRNAELFHGHKTDAGPDQEGEKAKMFST